jgi:hypothetical protein
MCFQYLPKLAADLCMFYRDNRKRRKGKKRQWKLMRKRTHKLNASYHVRFDK